MHVFLCCVIYILWGVVKIIICYYFDVCILHCCFSYNVYSTIPTITRPPQPETLLSKPSLKYHLRHHITASLRHYLTRLSRSPIITRRLVRAVHLFVITRFIRVIK